MGPQIENWDDDEEDSEPIEDGAVDENSWLNDDKEIGMTNDLTALAATPTNDGPSTDNKWT